MPVYLNDSGQASDAGTAPPPTGKVYLDDGGNPIGGRPLKETAAKSAARIKAGTDFPEGIDTTKAGWLESQGPLGAAIAHPIEALKGAGAAINPLPLIEHPIDTITKSEGERKAAFDRLRARGIKLISDDPKSPEAGQDLRDMYTYLVPLLGPGMASIGRQMGSTAPQEQAQGMGALGGMAAGAAAPGLVAKAGEMADASALAKMTKVTGDQPLSQELLAGGNAKMSNPPEAIAAYAEKNIPKDIPEPSRPGQFQTADIRDLRGQEAKYTNIRDNVAPDAMKPPDLPSIGGVAIDAAKAAGSGMYKASIPAYILRHVLGDKGAAMADIGVGTAKGAMVVGKYVKDVLASPKWQTAIATDQATAASFIKAIRTGDLNNIAAYGEAIIAGNEGSH